MVTNKHIDNIFFIMIKILKFLIIIPFLSLNAQANDINLELDLLFNQLKNANKEKSYKIEQQIWSLWSTHPTDKKLTVRLEEGSQLVRNQQLKKALMTSTVLQGTQGVRKVWGKNFFTHLIQVFVNV